MTQSACRGKDAAILVKQTLPQSFQVVDPVLKNGYRWSQSFTDWFMIIFRLAHNENMYFALTMGTVTLNWGDIAVVHSIVWYSQLQTRWDFVTVKRAPKE